MSTAAALQREGIDFLVLEARNYTGGRMHAFSFGDSSVGKFMVESCANWVQGGELNVVYKAAKKIGLKMSKESGSDQNFTNYPEVYQWPPSEYHRCHCPAQQNSSLCPPTCTIAVRKG
jgi:monoamine oxidase